MSFKCMLFPLILCSAVLSANASAEPNPGPKNRTAKWIWYPEKNQAHSKRYFRKTFTLPEKVLSARLFMACDDAGWVHANGSLTSRKFDIKMRTELYDLTGRIKKGHNVIALEIGNYIGPAGLALRGEFRLASGKVLHIISDGSWKTSRTKAKNWNSVDFNDSSWQNAKVLGNADMAPWNKYIDYSLLMSADKCAELSRFVPIPPEHKGRVIIDDFSDISSWMGGALWGMGSIPCARRDDGFCGAINFDLIKPDREMKFAKNAVYKFKAMPEAIEFYANPQGHDASIRFQFLDKSEQRCFTTSRIKLTGNSWKRYQLKLNPRTVQNYNRIMFPISLKTLYVKVKKLGKGKLLIDDIAYVVDVRKSRHALSLAPEYDVIAHAPGKPVELSFRVRNGLNKAVQVKLEMNVYDAKNQKRYHDTKKVRIEPFALKRVKFDVGSYERKGAYRIELTAANGGSKNKFNGWFGVFVPNGHRINKAPMWFGIEDQEIHTSPYEAKLHAKWMKLLGCDLLRAGTLGGRLESVRGSTKGYESSAKMWAPYFDAGMDLILYYAACPPSWTFSAEKKKRDPRWYSGMSDNPEMLKEHIRNVSRFMAAHPHIKYFEWINEPNLGGHSGTIDEYRKSLQEIYPIIKGIAPEVKVTTGGLAVSHPREKKNFSRMAIQDCADYYDIAVFHNHGAADSYRKNQKVIENWLKERKLKKTIGNSEAGYRSYYDSPKLFMKQAAALVKKITIAKSRNSEFYIWFMLQDYWDKYIKADDSFGLVTVNNQPKPSFIAYNELIRQLANTSAKPSLELDQRLDNYCFSNGREDVLVCWNKSPQKEFTFGVRSRFPITLIDIFGNTRKLKSTGGITYIKVPALPFYLRTAAGETAPVNRFLTTNADPVLAPGYTGSVTAELNNTYGEDILFGIIAGGIKFNGKLAAAKKYSFAVPVRVNAKASCGSKLCPVKIRLKNKSGRLLFDDTVNLNYTVAFPVYPDGSPGRSIILDHTDQMTELAFDPSTPRWSGPDDLSAKMKVSYNRNSLDFECTVIDSDHSVPYKNDSIWKNDSIQIAFANIRRKQTEITISTHKDGKAIVWCHITSKPSLKGKWEIPASATVKKGKITYRFSVPFDRILVRPEKDGIFRMSIMVNDNDKGKRLRIMEWNHGIENSKSQDLFGWVKLK